MTDEELIESLRSVAGGKLLYTNTPNHLRLSAADRIEELVKERDTAREYAGEVRIREKVADDARIEAEAKLAKAVDALRSVDDEYSDTKWGPELTSIKQVRDVLAELEGGSEPDQKQSL